ncbi:hypothetical protein TNCV_2961421 [Trichonephila clavipes]|nr:hypothetical protein TNCV_2961421 [Trichonephila clavipes]
MTGVVLMKSKVRILLPRKTLRKIKVKSILSQSSRWRRVEVWRFRCNLMCRSFHLTTTSYTVFRQEHHFRIHTIHVVITYSTLSIAKSDQGPRNSSRQRGQIRLSLAVAVSTIQVTERFGSIPPQFCRRTPGGVRDLPPLFLFPQFHEWTHGSMAI